MKSKFQRKHLSLKKETVAHLNLREMNFVKGGAEPCPPPTDLIWGCPHPDPEKYSFNTCND
jgi:natural product precursor